MTQNLQKPITSSKKDNILRSLSHFDVEDSELMHQYLTCKEQLLVQLMREGLTTPTSYKQNKMIEEAHERHMMEWAANGIII